MPMAACRLGATACGAAFDRYNELANAVLGQLDLAMPEIDLDSIRAAPVAPRRPVTPSR